MALSMLKQNVYEVLEPQKSEEEEGRMEMEVVEARLNVMHTVFLAIQSRPSLDAEILLNGQKIFLTLFTRHFTETLEVPVWVGLASFKWFDMFNREENTEIMSLFASNLRTSLTIQLKGHCPRLAEVTSVAEEVIFSSCDICSVRLFMEGLCAHFFSPYWRHYHTKDIQWFLEWANEQEHWGTNPLEHAQQQEHQQSVARSEVGHLFETHVCFLYMICSEFESRL